MREGTIKADSTTVLLFFSSHGKLAYDLVVLGRTGPDGELQHARTRLPSHRGSRPVHSITNVAIPPIAPAHSWPCSTCIAFSCREGVLSQAHGLRPRRCSGMREERPLRGVTWVPSRVQEGRLALSFLLPLQPSPSSRFRMSSTPIAFFGATGGCALACLVKTLNAGIESRALVRTPAKLSTLLLAAGVLQETLDLHLTIIPGSTIDTLAVQRPLRPPPATSSRALSPASAEDPKPSYGPSTSGTKTQPSAAPPWRPSSPPSPSSTSPLLPSSPSSPPPSTPASLPPPETSRSCTFGSILGSCKSSVPTSSRWRRK